MKTPPTKPVSTSDTLREQLAAAERQLEGWRKNGNDAQARVNALNAERADLLRGADPAKPGTLTKASAKLQTEIAEARSALADAHDSQDRLQAEITTIRQQLDDLETIEQRRGAVQAITDLVQLAAPVDRAVADLIAALRNLRAEAGNARTLVGEALQAMYPDPIRMLDMQDIVIARAGTGGPEASSAIAAILYTVAEVSGAKLDGHLAFNEFNRGTGTMTKALQACATVIASRLGVQVQP